VSGWLAVLLTGLGTYGCRAVFIIALANRHIPAHVRLAMEYVGPAVMAALVATMLVSPSGELVIGVAEVAALGMAALLARTTRNHLLTLLGAMVVFWMLRFSGLAGV
jgi:branched-subunit amino acid transport protein